MTQPKENKEKWEDVVKDSLKLTVRSGYHDKKTLDLRKFHELQVTQDRIIELQWKCVKKAVASVLHSKETELLQRVEGMERQYSGFVRNHALSPHSPITITNAHREGYNQALEEVKEIIKSLGTRE